VSLGGLFAGESMFHRRTDASKVALVGLTNLLRAAGGGPRVLDVQWPTQHLARLGVVTLSRPDYLALLDASASTPDAFAPTR
jgi:leucyl/phenylalanyl-tRNA--protein transferase